MKPSSKVTLETKFSNADIESTYNDEVPVV